MGACPAAVLERAQELCRRNGARLLFLTVFGSSLYGTDLPGMSDLDVRGVFAPSLRSLALRTAVFSLHESTGSSSSRNGAADTDLDLISVQTWLMDMLPAGVPAGTDLLFAAGRPECVLFRDPLLDGIFCHPLRYLGLAGGQACRSYCLRQARKYGIRGSRLWALRAFARELRRLLSADCRCGDSAPGYPLSRYAERLLSSCGDGSLLIPSDPPGGVRLAGRQYPGSMPAAEVLRRAEEQAAQTAPQGVDPDSGAGVDWKALSHAVRALRQDREILRTGNLRYPLACAGELRDIRQGRLPWRQVEGLVVRGLEEVEALRRLSPHAHEVPAEVSAEAVLRCCGM